jgi:hypothetical protein
MCHCAVTLLHAAFRNRSLKSRATTFVDVM